MPFDKQSWKDAILLTPFVKWELAKEKLKAKTLYGALAGSALWPLVQAAQGDPTAVAYALGSIGAGIGTNLISSKIEEWKNKAEGETDIAALIEHEIEQSDDLRDAVDDVLNRLDVLQNAIVAPKQVSDKKEFRKVLRKELRDLGNLHRFDLHLVIEDGFTKQRHDARKHYLDLFRHECRLLPQATIPVDPMISKEVSLGQVYIELDTTTRVDAKGNRLRDDRETLEKAAEEVRGKDEEKARLLPAWKAAETTPRMVLLGDPGSGKSTFVREYLAQYAEEAYEADRNIPVLITLRDLVPRLNGIKLTGQPDADRRARAAIVLEQALRDLSEMYKAAAFREDFERALTAGRCMIAFDGLDEVPQNARKIVRETVQDTLLTFHISQAIVTCRIRSYRGKAVFDGFEPFYLASLSDKQIERFVKAWYREQAQKVAIPDVAERISD